jgi:hypothetical protein
MNKETLKTELHHIIDGIESEELLQTIREFTEGKVSNYRKSNPTTDFESTPPFQLRIEKVASLSEKNIQDGELIEVETAKKQILEKLR